MKTDSNQRFNSASTLCGTIYRKNKNQYEVFAGEKRISCTLSNRLYQELSPAASHARPAAKKQPAAKNRPAEQNLPTVGDRVHVVATPNGGGTIVKVLPRENSLSRKAAGTGALPAEQVMVANVSLVMPVFAAANPAPRWNLLDRYLVTAEAMDLPSIICITKLDLAGQSDDLDAVEFQQLRAEFNQRVAEYRRIGYPVFLVSAASGEGLEALQEALRGQITVMLGKSGVGKSTLLNALQPGLHLRVGEVSRMTGKGKHTTTYLEMYPLDSGGAMIDTPGMREFGLWDIPADDLALFFPEIRPWVGQCRFGSGCRHDEEPGCAVRKAVMTGKISPYRYQSYLRMREDSEDELSI